MLFPLLASLLTSPGSLYPIAYEAQIGMSEETKIMIATGPGRFVEIGRGQYPATSPDQKSVAYASTVWMPDESVAPVPKTELRLADFATRKSRTLAAFSGPVTVSMPAFSHDGKRLCFELAPQRPGIHDPNLGIYTMNLPNGKPERVFGPTGLGQHYAWPTWTDGDKRILFVQGLDLLWLNLADKKVSGRPMRDLIGPAGDSAYIAMVRPSATNPNDMALLLQQRDNVQPNPQLDLAPVYGITNKPSFKFWALSEGPGTFEVQWHPSVKGIVYLQSDPGHSRVNFMFYDWATRKTTKLSE